MNIPPASDPSLADPPRHQPVVYRSQPAPVVPTPPRRPRAFTRLGLGLAGLAVAGGAYFTVDLALAHTTTTHASYAAAGTVELVADGQVSVLAAGSDVEVERIAYGGILQPQYNVSESAGRLAIAHECSWLPGRCSGSLEVTLPADTQVVVRTTNGDIRAAGVAGDLQATTSNGLVDVSDTGSSVRAESSNGDVLVQGAGGTVQATTSNGAIRVGDAAGSVTAQSSNGDVEVQGATGDVVARSSNGQVTVSGATGNVVAESSNGSVTVQGTGEPVALDISTSNGRQEVSGPTDPNAPRQVRIRSSNGDVAYLDGP